LQTIPKLLEGNSKRSGAYRVEGFDDQFVVSSGFVNA
jgi:hypothetical protein